MLPYAPLHFLLFHYAIGSPDGTGWLERPVDWALVMTSANPGGEPLAIDGTEAARRLVGIADAIADHDRPIVIRADDSVTRMIAGAPTVIRRARGWVPESVPLARAVPPVLALGGWLKTTVCVTRGHEAILSQHIGDLDNVATLNFLDQTVAHLLDITRVKPQALAHDLHPDFPSTRLAEALAAKWGVPCRPVQHHHAHVAAVAAEYGLNDGPVLGLALDGFGLGSDGGAWGGELLLLNGVEFTRLGHLATLAQPGGDLAARQPWRMAAAVLDRLGRGHEIATRFADCGPAAAGLARMLARGVNCPPTSSCGRWFDAACGLLGVRSRAGFEGEAPMVLESLVTQPRILPDGWTIDSNGVLDLLPLMAALLAVDQESGANLVHGTLAAALVEWTVPFALRLGLDRVVLSGGCVMNAVLTEALITGFAVAGLTALPPRRVPANDGGLALGQAWLTARWLEAKK
ncbi:hydrogenase maturation protein HypF [uncultured Gammaproteobacteria bacterium]